MDSPLGYDIDCGSGNLSTAEETYCTLNPEQHGEADLQNTVGNALNTVFFWVGIIAVIFIIVASINLAISAGSPDKVKKSKNSIMYAVAGLVIVLMSFAITNFTLNALQGKVEESGDSGDWKHVAIVGEVYSDYVILYDAGSRFIESKHYKHKVKRTDSLVTGDYLGFASWFGARLWDIDQNVTLAGL